MQVLGFTEFRQNLASALDYVEKNRAPIIIKRGKSSAVVISLEDYNAYMETMYLLSSPVNAERLRQSIAQYKQHKITQRDLVDAKVD